MQRLPNLLDFVDEPGEVPQRRVGGVVAAERTELVVVVVLDPDRRKPRVEALVELPPCSSSTLRSGLFPTRLVHTRNSPRGVLIGSIRDPPDRTSRGSHVEVS